MYASVLTLASWAGHPEGDDRVFLSQLPPLPHPTECLLSNSNAHAHRLGPGVLLSSLWKGRWEVSALLSQGPRIRDLQRRADGLCGLYPGLVSS